MPATAFDPEYPIDAMTPKLSRAANYIHIETQAPLAMCATSVLAAATASTHPHILACWRPGASCVCSQIFILEAETGERKTSVDRLAWREIMLFEQRQKLLAEEDEATFKVNMATWNAVRRGLERALEGSARRGEDLQPIKDSLSAHHAVKPVRPQRLLTLSINASAESVEEHLADVFPCVNMFAKDGGDAFNSGLLDKPQMVNSLWDDGSWESKRISRGTTSIAGASFCLYTAIQPAEFERHLRGRAKAALSSGNSSRWLYARPASTQGYRLDQFSERPGEWIADYWSRHRELLERLNSAPLPLRRRPKRFSKAARDLLVWYGREIEEALSDQGWFAQMRGVANKSAEVAGRQAASMAEFEGYRIVTADIVQVAIRIVAWHLNQYRLRFAPYTEDERDVIAMRIFFDEWVPKWLKRPKQYWFYNGPDMLHIVPNRLRRDVDRVKKAIRSIEAQDQAVRLVEAPVGRGWTVHFDPIHGMHLPEPSRELAPLTSRWASVEAPSRSPVVKEIEGIVLWPGVMLP